jgi:plastocyanin
MKYFRSWSIVSIASCLLIAASSVSAQQSTVTAQVEISGLQPAKKGSATDLGKVVLWLTPIGAAAFAKMPDLEAPLPTITQFNKSFAPHVLAVQVGASVLFPNRDRFLHNVFSLHEGKQFDLGFYEAGSSKTVRFDRPGVSYLFCNIHFEMTAAVVVVPTPYFALSDPSGRLTVPGVANGRYVLHVWSEQSLPEDLKKLEREVTVEGPATNLGAIRLSANPNFTSAHKNKYGQDYVPPSSADYNHP